MKRIVSLIVLSALACNGYSWNATGHQLVAQIAYDKLSPKAKMMCDKYNRSLDKIARSSSFVTSATWLDIIRYRDVHWFDSLHYIDIPFSNDGTALPPIPETNALLGIKNALTILKSNKTRINEKAVSLRVLTHVVGDIHQPLHTVAQVSSSLPNGDLGGNLFPLGKNPIGKNLHEYWDNGGGVLLGQSKLFQIQNKARQLEGKWSCKQATADKAPQQWVDASHLIAVKNVYSIDAGSVPSKTYQLKAQDTTEKQLFKAGCRLAMLLNEIAG